MNHSNTRNSNTSLFSLFLITHTERTLPMRIIGICATWIMWQPTNEHIYRHALWREEYREMNNKCQLGNSAAAAAAWLCCMVISVNYIVVAVVLIVVMFFLCHILHLVRFMEFLTVPFLLVELFIVPGSVCVFGIATRWKYLPGGKRRTIDGHYDFMLFN